MYFELFKKYLEENKNKKELVNLIRSTFPKEECIYALHILNEWDDSLHILSVDINSMHCENLVQAYEALYEKYYNMYREFIANLLNIKDLKKAILENIHFKPVLRMAELDAEKLMNKEMEDLYRADAKEISKFAPYIKLLNEFVKYFKDLESMKDFLEILPDTVSSKQELFSLAEEFSKVRS